MGPVYFWVGIFVCWFLVSWHQNISAGKIEEKIEELKEMLDELKSTVEEVNAHFEPEPDHLLGPERI